ncbi:hypothetical protein [Endozoicomonas ascidiicola]|nr:hypothetical protein [Endozoicomonas ascidiicola]
MNLQNNITIQHQSYSNTSPTTPQSLKKETATNRSVSTSSDNKVDSNSSSPLLDNTNKINISDCGHELKKLLPYNSANNLEDIQLPTQHDISVLRDLLNSIDGSKKDKQEALQNLAKVALNEIAAFDKAENTCPGTSLGTGKLALEIILFSSMAVLATINLLGITKDADFSDPGLALSKLAALPAAIAPGAMYTGSAIEIYKRFENWLAEKKDSNNKNCLETLREGVKNFRNMPLKTFLKKCVIFPSMAFAALTTVLDAKNAKSGIEGILKNTNLSPEALDKFGTAVGVGNGLVEGMMPLIVMPELFRSLTAPTLTLLHGRNHSDKQLQNISWQISETLNRSITPEQLEDILTESIESMPRSERHKLKSTFRAIAGNSNNLASDLVKLISGDTVDNTRTNTLKVRSIALAKVSVQLTGTFLCMWVFGSVFSASQKMNFYEEQLSQLNISSVNGTMNANNFTLTPYPALDNFVDIGSYTAQGVALSLYMYEFGESILNLIINCLHDPKSLIPEKDRTKTAVSILLAAVGVGCYGYIASGTTGTLMEVRELEAEHGIDTQFLPSDFQTSDILVILMLVSVLFRGAIRGIGTIADRIPTSSCCLSEANIRPIEDGEVVSSIKQTTD